MAATRRQEIIGRELVRIVNSMNDQIDCASYACRGIAHHTGGTLMMPDGGGSVPADFAYKKALALSHCNNIINYVNVVDSFIALVGVSKTRACVEAYLGTSWDDVKDDYDAILAEAQWVISNAGVATTDAHLITAANHIDAAIPKLELVRRLWAL